MIVKLDRQRRRLLGEAKNPRVPAAPAKAKTATAPAEVCISREPAAQADDGIPAFLNRADPLIAERMTAARKAAEAAERKQMPLTGRAALDAVRPQCQSRRVKISQQTTSCERASKAK